MSQELEDRFLNYAKAVRDFCTKLKWDVINMNIYKAINKGKRFCRFLMIYDNRMREWKLKFQEGKQKNQFIGFN